MSESNNSLRTKILIGGAVAGAFVGLATGYLLSRTIDESGSEGPDISTMDAIKAVIGVIGVMRGIAALGSRK